MKAIRQGIITETTKECLEDLETQRDSLKASILQLQLERRKFTKEEIMEWISKYKYGNINDLDYRKEIIDTFVNSVFVYDDKLVLTYNYKDGTETLTLQEIESVLSSNLTSMCPPKRKPHQMVWFFLFGMAFRCRTRTHSSGTARWAVPATSSKTGGYYNFCPWGKNANRVL